MSIARPLGASPLPFNVLPSHFPPVTARDVTPNPFNEFKSQPDFMVDDPNANFTQTHYHPSQAYADKALVLRTAITGQILEDANNRFYTAVLMPPRPLVGDRVTFSTLHFVNTVADVTPPEGVPRITESKMTSGTRAFTRRAIGLFQEHGYLRTAEGQEMYRLNLTHMATIVAETMCRDVIMAFVEADDYSFKWAMDHGEFNSFVTIEDVFRQEINRWGIIQKETHGFAKLDNEVCRLMERYGVSSPDTWILVKEIDVFLRTGAPEYTTYKEGGPAAVAQVSSSIGHTYDDVKPALIYGNKYAIYYSRTFISGENGPENPMTRERVIGEYFPMIPYSTERGTHYQTVHRDITIYDEDKDCYAVMTMQKAIEADVIFDEDGSLRSPNSPDFFTTHVERREEDLSNCFLYKPVDGQGDVVYEPIHCIGEIHQNAFQTTDLIEMAKSLVTSVSKQYSSKDCGDGQIYKDIDDGIRLIESVQKMGVEAWLQQIPFITADTDYQVRELQPDGREVSAGARLVTQFDEGSGATLSPKINSISASDMFTMIQAEKAKQSLTDVLITPEDLYPYMSNWAGLKYLSSRKFADGVPLMAQTQGIIIRFVDAVERLASFMHANLNGNPLVDGAKFTMPWAFVQSREQVLLSVLPQFADVFPVEFLVTGTLNNDGTTRRSKNDSVSDDRNLANALWGEAKKKRPDFENVSCLSDILTQIGFRVSGGALDAAELYFIATQMARSIFSINPASPSAGSKLTLDFVKDWFKNNQIGDLQSVVMNGAKIVPESTLALQESVIEILTQLLETLNDHESSKTLVTGVASMNELPLAVFTSAATAQTFLTTISPKKVKFVNLIGEIAQLGSLVDGNLNLWTQTVKEYTSVYKKLKEPETKKFAWKTNKKKGLPVAGKVPSPTQLLRKKELGRAQVGSRYIRSSFTLTRRQLMEYVALLQNQQNLNLLSSGKELLMTVSLPVNGYTKPATVEELIQFVGNRELDSVQGLSARFVDKLNKKGKKTLAFELNITSYLTKLGNRGINWDNSSEVTILAAIIQAERKQEDFSKIIMMSLKKKSKQDETEENKEPEELAKKVEKQGEAIKELQNSIATLRNLRPEVIQPNIPLPEINEDAPIHIEEGDSDGEYEEINDNLDVPVADENAPIVTDKDDELPAIDYLQMKIRGKHGMKRTREENERELFREHRQKAKKHRFEQQAHTVRQFGQRDSSYLNNSVSLLFYSHGGNKCYMDNPHFKSNWEAVGNKSAYTLDKLVAYAILTTPFHRNVFLNFVANNIILPFNYLLLRPHQRYLTALGIKTVAGSKMGSVFYNPDQSNLMEEDRATTKTRLTHYSWYARAVVTNPALVHLAWDIFIMDTRGGAGTQFYTAEDNDGGYAPDQNQYGRRGASIFPVMISYREKKEDIKDCIDASGRFSYVLVAGLRDIKSGNRAHYSTAVVYNAFWRWRGTNQIATVDFKNNYHPLLIAEGASLPTNTAVWQGPYRCYDPRTNKEIAVIGKGHYGSFSYPGCQILRRGGTKPWVMPTMYQTGIVN